ncbi:hypothetical protein PC121_g22337 [Phytophthora cactorum]|nr:hypothetical protein PC121_g22337 [Phytophthora cactorum]
MPSPATNYKLKALLGQVADAQSVAMKLQCEELNLLDARDLLNGLLEVMPSFGDYLMRSSLQPFLRRAPPPVRQEEPAKVSFAYRILKRRKVDDVPNAYILLVQSHQL